MEFQFKRLECANAEIKMLNILNHFGDGFDFRERINNGK